MLNVESNDMLKLMMMHILIQLCIKPILLQYVKQTSRI